MVVSRSPKLRPIQRGPPTPRPSDYPEIRFEKGLSSRFLKWERDCEVIGVGEGGTDHDLAYGTEEKDLKERTHTCKHGPCALLP